MTFTSGLNALLQRFMSRTSSKSPMSSPRSLDHDSEVRNALLQRFMSRTSSKSPMSSPRSLDHGSEVRNALLQRFMSRTSSKSPMSSPRSLDHDSEVRKGITIFSLNIIYPIYVVYLLSLLFKKGRHFRNMSQGKIPG